MSTKRTKFTETELSALREAYNGLEVVSIDRLPQFHAIFEQCDDAALRQLINAKVKFVSKLAINAAIRRGTDLGQSVPTDAHGRILFEGMPGYVPPQIPQV